MQSMISYTKAAMERAMKVQEVILRAMAQKITWWQAAEIIGISDRHMRRWRERYEEFGYDGLFDRRRGQPSPKRVPLAVVEQVLGLYRERYHDLNVRHFHEKLSEEHQIELSYTWVKLALQGAGLVERGRKRGGHRKRRPRRPLPGMLLHSDRGSQFWLTPKGGGRVDPHRLTQVGRALRELGVQMIPAYSPQARGRSERNFGTWQGRLPQELRLAGIHTVEEANQFLRNYVGEFNAKFTVAAAQKGTAFRRCTRTDLDWIFTVQSERVVAKDNTVAIGERRWQLDKSRFRHTLSGCTVMIHQHLDGRVSIRYGPHTVGRFDAQGKPLRPAARGAAA